MITMQTINATLFAPVFFFLSIVIYLVVVACLFAFFKTSASFGVVSCILFVIAYNMWVFANKLKE